MEARFIEEATRLTSLDAKGRNIEALAMALRQGEESEISAKILHEMDMEFLAEWVDGRGRSEESGPVRGEG